MGTGLLKICAKARCAFTCRNCVTFVGNSRRACTVTASAAFVDAFSQQRQRQQICRRHCVLNSQIDADASRGRHSVGRVADA